VLPLGLVVELVFAVILKKPPIEWISTLVADALIVAGVWAELQFGRLARVAGDAAQSEANARGKEADKKAADALERAAASDLKRVELEARLQPRMTDQRQFDLIQTLRGKLSEITIAYETDAETQWFAGSLRDAFFIAGIRVGM
jgi:hypothetical protein